MDVLEGRTPSFYKGTAIIIIVAFIATFIGPIPALPQDFRLPAPGIRVALSLPFNPPVLKGIKVYPNNPFQFDFILDKGDSVLGNDQLKAESRKLIKYFLASMTVPENELWVNLSPYEKDRIIPQGFGLTEMGRDLLAEDYMLKQVTASLIYPEDEIGKRFWKRVYEEASKKYGTTNIPVSTFNKVWIVPQKAVIFENAKAGTAYVVESRLKVMLEQDYLSLEKHAGIQSGQVKFSDTSALGSNIVREVVIPELTREVNENKNFTQLRQVYNSLILANWYKNKVKDSILMQVYANKNKVAGVNISDFNEKEKIYQRYLRAFKKGVYNYIKEEPDIISGQTISRKYFSGGIAMAMKNTSVVMSPSSFRSEFAMIDANSKEELVVRGEVRQANPLFRLVQKKMPGIAEKLLKGRISKMIPGIDNLNLNRMVNAIMRTSNALQAANSLSDLDTSLSRNKIFQGRDKINTRVEVYLKLLESAVDAVDAVASVNKFVQVLGKPDETALVEQTITQMVQYPNARQIADYEVELIGRIDKLKTEKGLDLTNRLEAILLGVSEQGLNFENLNQRLTPEALEALGNFNKAFPVNVWKKFGEVFTLLLSRENIVESATSLNKWWQASGRNFFFHTYDEIPVAVGIGQTPYWLSILKSLAGRPDNVAASESLIQFWNLAKTEGVFGDSVPTSAEVMGALAQKQDVAGWVNRLSGAVDILGQLGNDGKGMIRPAVVHIARQNNYSLADRLRSAYESNTPDSAEEFVAALRESQSSWNSLANATGMTAREIDAIKRDLLIRKLTGRQETMLETLRGFFPNIQDSVIRAEIQAIDERSDRDEFIKALVGGLEALRRQGASVDFLLDFLRAISKEEGPQEISRRLVSTHILLKGYGVSDIDARKILFGSDKGMNRDIVESLEDNYTQDLLNELNQRLTLNFPQGVRMMGQVIGQGANMANNISKINSFLDNLDKFKISSAQMEQMARMLGKFEIGEFSEQLTFQSAVIDLLSNLDHFGFSRASMNEILGDLLSDIIYSSEKPKEGNIMRLKKILELCNPVYPNAMKPDTMEVMLRSVLGRNSLEANLRNMENHQRSAHELYLFLKDIPLGSTAIGALITEFLVFQKNKNVSRDDGTEWMKNIESQLGSMKSALAGLNKAVVQQNFTPDTIEVIFSELPPWETYSGSIVNDINELTKKVNYYLFGNVDQQLMRNTSLDRMVRQEFIRHIIKDKESDKINWVRNNIERINSLNLRLKAFGMSVSQISDVLPRLCFNFMQNRNNIDDMLAAVGILKGLRGDNEKEGNALARNYIAQYSRNDSLFNLSENKEHLKRLVDSLVVLKIPGINFLVMKIIKEDQWPLINRLNRWLAAIDIDNPDYHDSIERVFTAFDSEGIKKGIEQLREEEAKLPKSLEVVPTSAPSTVTKAMKPTGGIDLTRYHFNLQTNSPGGEIKLHFNPAMLAQLQKAPGFDADVVSIQPLKSLSDFLGVSKEISINANSSV